MSSEVISSETDSDTDSLPDISHLFEKPETNLPIKQDDIVFAKYKGLYWPALVRSVYPKQKKLCIWYCDQPGKTFKLPLKNVCQFNDWDKRAGIRKDIREAGYTEAHEGLTFHARSYLRRKFQGHKDDPLKFFDQTYPFYLIETVLKKDPNTEGSGLKIPPLYISHENKQNAVKKRLSEIASQDSCDSELESVDNEDGTSETEQADCKKHEIRNLWKSNSNLSTVEYVNKIVAVIKSGNTDKYLKKILSETVSSEFYTAFEEARKDGKKDDGSVSYAGPIQDGNKVCELTTYLLSLFDNITTIHGAAKADRLKRSLNSNRDIAHYVASVWLPESIIYAIAQIQNISLPEAKRLFKELPTFKKEEIINIATTQVKAFQRNKPKEINAEQIKQECINKKACVHLSRVKAAESSNKKVSNGSAFKIQTKSSKRAKEGRSGINNKIGKGDDDDDEVLAIESCVNASPRKNSKETAKSNCSTQLELPGLKSNSVSLQKISKKQKKNSDCNSSMKTAKRQRKRI